MGSKAGTPGAINQARKREEFTRFLHDSVLQPKPEQRPPKAKGFAWTWCRFKGHWWQRPRADKGTVAHSCPEHRREWEAERTRLWREFARISERPLNDTSDDYRWAALHSLRGMPGHHTNWMRRSTSMSGFPSADAELLCGCVPGFLHGPKCTDGQAGKRCVAPRVTIRASERILEMYCSGAAFDDIAWETGLTVQAVKDELVRLHESGVNVPLRC